MSKSKEDHYWLDVINQCRSSGLTDKQWCLKNNIAPSTFYYHIRSLRKKAGEIPAIHRLEPDNRQEVVSISLEEGNPEIGAGAGRLPAVRISLRGMSIKVLNHAEESVITNILLALQKLC